jgi:hypothetical protein
MSPNYAQLWADWQTLKKSASNRAHAAQLYNAELPFRVIGSCFTKFDDGVSSNPYSSTLRSLSSSDFSAHFSANTSSKKRFGFRQCLTMGSYLCPSTL